MESAPKFPMRVAIESANGALRIWDAVLKACEARGLHVSAGERRVKVSDGMGWVALRLAEKVDQVKRAVMLGDDIVMARRPTGFLRMYVNETKIEGAAGHPLEQQLNDVMVRIYRSIALQYTGREMAGERRRRDEVAAQERERAATAEAARLRDMELQRMQPEQDAAAERERLLIAEAAAWRDAMAIRAYAGHIQAAMGEERPCALRTWLDWAESVAERLDPTRKRIG